MTAILPKYLCVNVTKCTMYLLTLCLLATPSSSIRFNHSVFYNCLVLIGMVVGSTLHPPADSHAFNPSEWTLVETFQASLLAFGAWHPAPIALYAPVTTGITWFIDCLDHCETRRRVHSGEMRKPPEP